MEFLGDDVLPMARMLLIFLHILAIVAAGIDPLGFHGHFAAENLVG